MRELSDGVRNDIRAVAALVPRLLAHQLLCSPKQHGLYDHAPVILVVELLRALLPLFRGITAERHEVFLRALAYDVWKEAPGDFIFRQIRLRDELLLGVLQNKLLALCWRECDLFIRVLPAGALVEPVRSVLCATDGGCAQALGNLFHAAVKFMVREEVRLADPVLAVRI